MTVTRLYPTDEIRAARKAGSSFASITRTYQINDKAARHICRDIPRPPRHTIWERLPFHTLVDALHKAGLSKNLVAELGWPLRHETETGLIDAYKADEICQRVLWCHPVAVYGDLWWQPMIEAGTA